MNWLKSTPMHPIRIPARHQRDRFPRTAEEKSLIRKRRLHRRWMREKGITKVKRLIEDQPETRAERRPFDDEDFFA